MDQPAIRALFPILRDCVYLNSAGVTPMSLPAQAAVSETAAAFSSRPLDNAWLMELPEMVRAGLGRLLNASPDGIVLTRSTAHGLSLLAAGLDWREGDNIVSAQGEFPSNIYPWMSVEHRGVELRLVETEEGRVTPEAVAARMDERTRVVALSHVEFWNGHRTDLRRIGDECRRSGVLFAVDAMQSAGMLSLDLTNLPVDLVAAGTAKWMLGPIGLGFCWFHPALLQRVRPVHVGPRSTVEMTSFFDYDLTFAPTARRFEEGWPAPLLLTHLQASLGILLDAGAVEIERHVLGLSGRLADGLHRIGCSMLAPWPRAAEESSALVSFRVPGVPAERVMEALSAAGIIGGTHQDFIRLSPHLFNIEADADAALAVISGLMESA